MKKVLLGAALLLVLNTIHATPSTSHSEPRNILSSELPAVLQSAIRTTYAGYWITDLAVNGKEKRAKYQVTLENGDQVITLKAGKEKTWTIISTMVK